MMPAVPEELRVLIVDDQPAVVNALATLLDVHDIPYVCAASPDQACRVAKKERVGVVLQDMNFGPNETSGRDGVTLFRALRAADPQLPILLITAWASVEAAVALIKEGANDYIQKPWDDEKLLASVRNLLRMRALEIENAQLRAASQAPQQTLAQKHDLCGIVYASAEMHEVVSLAIAVASSNAPVLVTGPSGSGKERMAEIIQANSRQRAGPFVRVNVGAIPDELIESELFGAEPGAYTGLRALRIGHFETAHNGTLFLDEIDGLSLSGQVKLLRVVQSGELLRLGSSTARRVDVRVISATNANLRDAVAAGRFREDLFFRLNVVELPIPGLMSRRADILPLARHFLARHAREEGRELLGLSRAAEDALLQHTWSGNVRELENRLHRALLVARGSDIEARDLDMGSQESRPAAQPALSAAEMGERETIMSALSDAQGVVAHAAEVLGISRQTLYRKMSRLGIDVERKPRSDRRDPT